MADDRQEVLDRFLSEGATAPAPAPESAPDAVVVEAASPPAPPAEVKDPRQERLDQFITQRRQEGASEEVADMTAAGLEEARVTFTPDTGPFRLVGRIARSATFGASDLINAKIIQFQLREEIPDVTYVETLAAIRKGFEDDPNVLAEVAGTLVPSLAIGKGAEKAWLAARQAGLVNGALRWAAGNPTLARIAGAAGLGSLGGAVEEGIRTSVDESIGAAVGDEFDGDRIVDATITGALVGGLAGGALQTAARGVGPIPGVLDFWDRWFKEGLNLSGVQEQKAAARLFNAARVGNETPEEAAQRLQDAAGDFFRKNGRMPALSDLMAPEDVKDVADITRFFSGLDRTSARLAREGIDRATDALETAATQGQRLSSGALFAPTKRLLDAGDAEGAVDAFESALTRRSSASGEQLEAQIEDVFTGVSKQFGQTPVAVSDEVLDALAPARAWIGKQSASNPGAREIERVITAKDNIDSVRQRVGNLRNARNAAALRDEVAKLDTEINALISNPSTEAGARAEVANLGPGDEALGALRNLRNMLGAKTARMQSSAGVARAEQNLGELEPTLRAMERALDDYRANGLKISLKDANHMRAAASRFVNKSLDLAEQDTARAVREAIAPVGTTEVPSYGKAVRLWRDTLTRAESQPTGVAAAKGEIDLGDLATRVREGRIPTRKGRSTGTAKSAQDSGVREGALRQLGREATGTRREAIAAGERVADSPRVREGLEIAASDDASRVVTAAEDVRNIAARARALSSSISPSTTAEEFAQIQEAALGVAFGNLGGAGRAGAIARFVQGARMSRGQAEKTLEMLADPKQFDQALRFMESKGVDFGALTGALVAAEFGRGAEQ